MKSVSDFIYNMVLEANLTSTQMQEVFYVLARRIAKVCDGHTLRKIMIKYKLEKYFYGEGNLQEVLSNNYNLWKAVWHCIQNIKFEKKEIEEVSKIFSVQVVDIEFIISNLCQIDIQIIQDTYYDPISDFNKYDSAKLIKELEPRIKALVNSVQYIYQYDKGHSRENFIGDATLKAMEGFRIYEGECNDEKDLKNKMYSRANSFIKSTHKRLEDNKPIEKHGDGYRLIQYSLEGRAEGKDAGDKCLGDFISSDTDENVHLKEYLNDSEKFLSKNVFLYVKTILNGSSDVDKDDPSYYRKTRQKFNVTLKQVKKEVYNFLNILKEV